MHAEHFKEWLLGVVEEEEKGMEEMGDRWWLFTKLAQFIWEYGYIPEQMTWILIILLPKGGGRNRGIGLLEPCWKVTESILVQHLLAIKFHNLLHGSINMKGTGTTTIEVKLVQQLVVLDQKPWHQIFWTHTRPMTPWIA
jgi:hypothetical protein